MTKLGGIDNSSNKRILDVLKSFSLKIRKIKVKRITVVKLRVNNGGGDGTGSFEIKRRTYTTNVQKTCFGEMTSDLRK